jgi:glycosyltransferase involved in cell wall biosynthesis
MNINDKMPTKGWSASGGKKILYIITQSELGGAQRYILDLAKNLKEEFEISVAFGEQGEKGKLARKLAENSINHYTVPYLKRAISPINDFLAFISIIKLIKKLRPDIIHLNSSKISIIGSLAAKSCYVLYVKCYVVYTVHGWVFNEPLPLWQRLFYKYAEKFTAFLKDKIICVSEYERQIAIQEKITHEKKLITIHNGIEEINLLLPEQARRKLSQIKNSKFKIQNSKFIIGTIANLYKTKGLEYLIEAIRLLINIGLNITTIVIGEGEERKNLEDLIAQTNLKNNFILVGEINNAACILPAFDVYVCSSLKEGFPYTILEAMSAGLPIVSTNVGGISEIITDKESGILVEPKNPKALAEGIKKLIDSEELRNTLGERSKKDVKEKFGLEKMIKKTKDVYLK